MPVVLTLGQTPRVNPFRLSTSPVPIEDPPSAPPPSSSPFAPASSPHPSYTWTAPPVPSLPYASSSQPTRRSSSTFDSSHQFSRKKAKHAPSSTPIQSSSAVTSYTTPSLVGTRQHRRTPHSSSSSSPFPPSAAAGAESTDLSDVPLSPGQLAVRDAVLAHRSVFFTGCAGTGKSFLLNYLKQKLPSHSTFFTASTGLAAINVQGSTIHSFAGIGLGVETKEKLCEMIFNRVLPKKRWRSCSILVIDEISMIDCALFDKLEYIARKIRNSDRPFGGIQLILTGDFLQLPPVRSMGFCFESARWSECVDVVIELESVFRQEDSSLVSVLNNVRRGVIDQAALKAFQSCVNRQFDVSDGIVATRLYPKRAQVTDENTERLNQLPAEPFIYHAVDRGTDAYIDTLRKGCNAADVLTVKVGAQVMLIKNLNTGRGLVNGSRGVVEDFVRSPDEGRGVDIPAEWNRVIHNNRWPQVRFVNGERVICTPEQWSVEVGTKPVASRLQVPLMLAWSLTMHKCQGMTLDRVSLHLGGVFEQGQAYVALSRIRSLDSLCIQDRFDPRVIVANPKALHFYDELAKQRRTALDAEGASLPNTQAEAQSARKTTTSAQSLAHAPFDPEGMDDYDELTDAMIDEDLSRRGQSELLDSELDRVDEVGHYIDTQGDFAPASRLLGEQQQPQSSKASASPPYASFPPSKPAALLAARAAAVDHRASRGPKVPYQGEREEIDLLSDDEQTTQPTKGEEVAMEAHRMELEVGPSLSPPHLEVVASSAMQEVRATSSSTVTAADSSTDLASLSQPGASPASASQPRASTLKNPFSAPRPLPPRSSSSIALSSSSPSPAASSSSPPSFSLFSASTRSPRLAKSLHPPHAHTAVRSPLLRATCRVHGEALTTQERKVGEEEHRTQQRAEGEAMMADERKEGETAGSEKDGGASTWIYRCARGCSMAIST